MGEVSRVQNPLKFDLRNNWHHDTLCVHNRHPSLSFAPAEVPRRPDFRYCNWMFGSITASL